MLNIVRHHLRLNQIRSQTISGEIKISDRQAIVQAFNSDENQFMVVIREDLLGFTNFRFY